MTNIVIPRQAFLEQVSKGGPTWTESIACSDVMMDHFYDFYLFTMLSCFIQVVSNSKHDATFKNSAKFLNADQNVAFQDDELIDFTRVSILLDMPNGTFVTTESFSFKPKDFQPALTEKDRLFFGHEIMTYIACVDKAIGLKFFTRTSEIEEELQIKKMEMIDSPSDTFCFFEYDFLSIRLNNHTLFKSLDYLPEIINFYPYLTYEQALNPDLSQNETKFIFKFRRYHCYHWFKAYFNFFAQSCSDFYKNENITFWQIEFTHIQPSKKKTGGKNMKPDINVAMKYLTRTYFKFKIKSTPTVIFVRFDADILILNEQEVRTHYSIVFFTIKNNTFMNTFSLLLDSYNHRNNFTMFWIFK